MNFDEFAAQLHRLVKEAPAESTRLAADTLLIDIARVILIDPWEDAEKFLSFFENGV